MSPCEQVLGLSSALAGMVGSVGNLSRTPSLIILGGLSALIGIMLSFIYLEQVGALLAGLRNLPVFPAL